MKKRLIAVFLLMVFVFSLIPEALAATKVKSVSINKTSLTITVGNTYQLNATVNPSNATNKKVTWKSSNSSIVSVSGSGKLTAKKAGTATITVVSQSNSSKKATCKVTVKNPAVQKVSLNTTSLTVMLGTCHNLYATVSPSNANNKKVTWTSSNSSVITVSNNGMLTPKKVGSATITVTSQSDKSKKATCKVTVKQPSVRSVTLNKTSLEIYKGSSYSLKAIVSPTGANPNVTWSSSNNKVATVSSGGVVTAKGVGSATITAKTKDGNKTATCKITVPKTKTYTKTYAFHDEGRSIGCMGQDIISIVVDEKNNKIVSADVRQKKSDLGVGITINTDGCKITYQCNDYILVRTSWSYKIGIGAGKIKIGWDIGHTDLEYKMYKDGTLKLVKKTRY